MVQRQRAWWWAGILIAWAAGTGAVWTLPHPWVLTVVGVLVGVAGSGPVIRGLGGLPRQRVGLTPRLTHAPAEQAGWPALPTTVTACLIIAAGMVGVFTVNLRR
jgi:hypothetical protein